MDEAIHTKKLAVEEFVATTLISAEELAKLSRRGQRELGFSE